MIKYIELIYIRIKLVEAESCKRASFFIVSNWAVYTDGRRACVKFCHAQFLIIWRLQITYSCVWHKFDRHKLSGDDEGSSIATAPFLEPMLTSHRLLKLLVKYLTKLAYFHGSNWNGCDFPPHSPGLNPLSVNNLVSKTTRVQQILSSSIPCKHAVMCQHWAASGLMLAASAQNQHSAGMFTG